MDGDVHKRDSVYAHLPITGQWRICLRVKKLQKAEGCVINVCEYLDPDGATCDKLYHQRASAFECSVQTRQTPCYRRSPVAQEDRKCVLPFPRLQIVTSGGLSAPSCVDPLPPPTPSGVTSTSTCAWVQSAPPHTTPMTHFEPVYIAMVTQAAQPSVQQVKFCLLNPRVKLNCSSVPL